MVVDLTLLVYSMDGFESIFLSIAPRKLNSTLIELIFSQSGTLPMIGVDMRMVLFVFLWMIIIVVAAAARRFGFSSEHWSRAFWY